MILNQKYDILNRFQNDSEFQQLQKISHSKDTLSKIFEHLCSIDIRGEDNLVLAIPVPLDEYNKAHNITDITIHEHLDIDLDNLFNAVQKENETYAFLPIEENPANVKSGLKHLENKEYSTTLSHYTNTQEKCKIFDSLFKESKYYVDKIIEDKITKPFFNNTKIPDHIYGQIKFMITNAIMNNYTIYHKDVFNVCRTTQEEINSKQLHETMNDILQNKTIITQRENIVKTLLEINKLLEQFKSEMKKMVTKTRGGYIVKGKCDLCT